MSEALPHGWITTRLADVVDVLDNRRVPVNARERRSRVGSVPYYGATGQVGFIDDHIFDEHLVLLGEDGAPFLDAAKPKAYAIHGRSWVNNHAHVLRGRNGVLNAFVMHQLNSVDFRPFVSGTTRLKLPQGPMNEIPIRLAATNEQRRIAEALETHLTRLDAAVATLKRVRANLKRYRAAVLLAAVEGRLLTGSECRHAVALTGWRLVSVGDLAEVGTGATPKRGTARYYENASIPWVTSGALNDLVVTEAREFVTDVALAETNLTVYPPGTLLVAMYGEGKTRGKCATLGIPATTNQAIAAIQLRPEFAEYHAWLRVVLEHQYAAMRRMAAGGVQPNLNLSLVRSISVPLPPVAQATEIEAEAARLLSLVEAVQVLLATNEARVTRLRQSLLLLAFAGRLVPQDPRDEPASVLLDRIHHERAAGAPSKERKSPRSRR